jgi:hypothetical protein
MNIAIISRFPVRLATTGGTIYVSWVAVMAFFGVAAQHGG